MACWITKVAISLKHIEIEEKLLWRAYRKSPTLFRTVPSPTPYGLPFPQIGGSQSHPKTAITIISGTAKATDCKFGRYIYRVHPNTGRWNILEKRERGRIQGLPKFFWVPPIISGTFKATNFKLGRYIQRVHPNTSPWNILEKRERGRIQRRPKLFWVPPIISRTGKATNFKFCTHILSIDRNKSPLQISGKVAGCVVRTGKTFQGTHILGA